MLIVAVEGVKFQESVEVTVNRPTSATGLKLWKRFLSDGEFHYHYISTATIGALVPEIDFGEPAESTKSELSSEYSEGLATETLARMSFSGWSSLVSATDVANLRNRFRSKRDLVGTRRSLGVHPAECLALALVDQTNASTSSDKLTQVLGCTGSNRYYSALAQALANRQPQRLDGSE